MAATSPVLYPLGSLVSIAPHGNRAKGFTGKVLEYVYKQDPKRQQMAIAYKVRVNDDPKNSEEVVACKYARLRTSGKDDTWWEKERVDESTSEEEEESEYSEDDDEIEVTSGKIPILAGPTLSPTEEDDDEQLPITRRLLQNRSPASKSEREVSNEVKSMNIRKFVLPVEASNDEFDESENNAPKISSPIAAGSSKKKQKLDSSKENNIKKFEVEEDDEADDDDFEDDTENKHAKKSSKQSQVSVASSSSDNSTSTQAHRPSVVPVSSSAASNPSSTSKVAAAAALVKIEKKSKDDDIQSILGETKAVALPAGLAGIIGQYLMDMNRPCNITSIAQKFKDTYTRAQIEKGLNTLVEKNVVQCLEDGAKIYWMNQSVVENASSHLKEKQSQIDAWASRTENLIRKLEQERDQVEARVKAMILAPGDAELEQLLLSERIVVSALAARVDECEKAVKDAEKLGKSAAVVHANTVSQLQIQLLFYRNHWRDRKRSLNDFIDKVCDAKGLKKSGRKELLETMGIETDEDLGATLLKGTQV